MKAVINRDECIGCGVCVDMVPSVFELGDDTIAVAKANPIPQADERACKDAAEACPVDAISIEE